MRKVTAGVVSLVLASGAGAAFGLAPASAAPPVNGGSATSAKSQTQTSDELNNPLESKRRDLRAAALNDVLAGKAKPVTKNGSTVVKVGSSATSKKQGQKAAAPTKDQYVELKREKTDKIFVILAEFGNERHPDFPDKDQRRHPRPDDLRGPAAQRDPRARPRG